MTVPSHGLLRGSHNLCLGPLIEAVRNQTRIVDLKQVNRVLIQPHWRRKITTPVRPEIGEKRKIRPSRCLCGEKSRLLENLKTNHPCRNPTIRARLFGTNYDGSVVRDPKNLR